jgi:WD40 repeat protein
MYKLLLIVIIIFILVGCTDKSITPTSLIQATSTQSATTTPVLTRTFTSTLAPTITQTPIPTNTPLPTHTPSPTFTSTPALPVGLGISLPQPSKPITSSNISSLTELARYGNTRIYDTYLSADRTRIFSFTGDGIKVYQTSDMERIAWFTGLHPRQSDWGGIIWDITASANGNHFTLLTSNNQVQIFDVQAGLIYTHTLTVAWNPWATISMDGSYLALPKPSEDGWSTHWQIVDLSTGTILANGIGTNVKFSPLGTILSAQSGNNLYIYRTTDWNKQTQIGLSGLGENASNWFFSPDDRYLALVFPKKIVIWEVENRQRVREIHPLGGAQAEIYNAFFSENGQQIAVLQANQRQSELLIWNIADGNLVSQQPAREAGVYTYDELLLMADGLFGYNVPREGDGSEYQVPQWESNPWAFDLNGENLSLVDLAWDAETNQSYYKVCAFAFSGSDGLPCQDIRGALGITSDGFGHFYSLWQEQQGNTVSLYTGLEHGDTALVTFSTNGYPINLNAVSPNHSLMAYSLGQGQSTIQVRDLVSNRMIFTEDTTGRIEDVQFTPDGLRMAVTMNNPEISHPQILIYDAAMNAVIYRLPALGFQSGESPVLSDTGEWLAFRLQISTAYRWSGIKIFDPFHQRELASFEGDLASLGNPIAFSPDGTLLATIDNHGTVFLLDAATGEVLHSWVAHTDKITNLTFSADSRLLGTSGEDGLVRIWGIWP